MTKNRTLKTLLTVVLLAGIGSLAVSSNFYASAIIDGFFALALGSVAILHFRVRPSWVDALLILASTVILAVIDFLVLDYPFKVAAWFSFLGLSSLLVLGIRAIWPEGDSRKLLVMAFVPALLFVTSEYFASDLLEWTEKAHPKSLDLYLLSFDSSLRVQFPFLMGQVFQKLAWLRLPSELFYVGLPIPIALVYAGQLTRVREKSLPAMAAFLMAGPVGVVFYNLFPALGPIHIFRSDYPWNPLPISKVPFLFLEPISVPGPRNAIPSLHLAWALLAWWYSKGLSWWERTVAMLFVIFTALATLGIGEHYFVDLIVAYPFTLMIMGICACSLPWKDAKRVSAFFFGLVVTLGWLAALRFTPRLFWISPLVPWLLCATTVALCVFYNRRLQRAVTKHQAMGTNPQQSIAAMQALLEEEREGALMDP